MNPFARLGLPASLVLDEDTLKNAHHQAAAGASPDALAEIHRDYEILRDPSRRIAVFQEIHGKSTPPQTAPGGALFAFFSDVETAFRQADLALNRTASATTALQRAAHLPELLNAQTHLERILTELQKHTNGRNTILQWMDESGSDLSKAEWNNLRTIASDFVFLQKWETGARQRLGKVQALLFGELT